MIDIEDLKKIDLRIGTIVSADAVEGSEKLLKLGVDLGSEKRQILAGLAKTYNTLDLVGKQIVIVANLAPRSMMGFESQGMALAADGEMGPILLVPDITAQPGTVVK